MDAPPRTAQSEAFLFPEMKAGIKRKNAKTWEEQEFRILLASLRLCAFALKSMSEENQQPLQQPEQPKERKSLDDRAKMTELERTRHSAAHVLAAAILRLWPEAQFASSYRSRTVFPATRHES